MRLILTTDAVGGVWTYTRDLADALGAAGVDVLVALMGPVPAGLDHAALALVDTGLPLDWLAADEAAVRDAAAALARLARERGADLVQIHSPALACADFAVPVVALIHSCVASWWEAVKDGPLPVDLAWRAALVAEGLRRSILAVAPSHAFAAAVERCYGVLPQVVHNGRSPLPLPSGLPRSDTVLTAGRLGDEGKNVTTLDRAAAFLSVPLEAAGSLREPHGGGVTLDHAVALGRLSDDALAAKLAARPVFASAALYEPFGLAVLEAAQAGCALLLADTPVFRELWDGAATFVPACDAAAFAEAAERLLQDPQERDRLGAAARARAARFTPRATAAAMLGHYRSVIGADARVAA
ncbi:glycosyltransferase [Sphingomonas ginkgonis]|uniref:glycosyltransferase n=1 Tax=Sphingomonas ginkgonis TaxID=2315330 RepID=UPI001EF0C24A|nr:glycosyltransferase [Sphingomonas ginkgonis]